MTAQSQEIITIDGKKTSMCSEPLYQYLSLTSIDYSFVARSTNLWRGYIGEWEILHGRLYLIGFIGEIENGIEIKLKDMFHKYGKRAFAHWYNGTLRIPQGELLEYVHMGYGSTYEQDRNIVIKKGVVIEDEVVKNSDKVTTSTGGRWWK
jgi:hypothetical protein